MILGRPTNLWLGFTTAVLGLVSILAVTVGKFDPTTVATVTGAVGVVIGSAIGLIAGQPAQIKEGASYTVVTAGDAPNVEKIANRVPTPPANLVKK
jgi:hypothetical protein